MTTTAQTTPSSTFAAALRRLYIVRFIFALAWAGLLFLASPATGPVVTILLIVYPLFDAAAVLWQLLRGRDAPRGRGAEWANVAVSTVVAVAVGIASAVSIPAALAIWGLWAIGSGIPQLIAALRNRRSGGQVPQMLSGGISVLAGVAFLAQGLQGSGAIGGVGGYAVLGGIFFLVSAIRLSILLRKNAA